MSIVYLVTNAHYNIMVSLSVVELQSAVHLHDHDVDVERRQSWGVHSVTLVTEVAFVNDSHHPADEGLVQKHFDRRLALVMSHELNPDASIGEAFSQVVVFHLITGEEGEKRRLSISETQLCKMGKNNNPIRQTKKKITAVEMN